MTSRSVNYPKFKVVAANKEVVYSIHRTEKAAQRAAEYRRIAMDEPACLNLTSSVIVVPRHAEFNRIDSHWES